MDIVKAQKIQKTSWTDTIRNMVVGSVLECTLKERLSAASRISEIKKRNPELGLEFSEWEQIGDNLYRVTRIA